MSKVLVINASPRKERSHSRDLTAFFVENWSRKQPEDTFIHREVGKTCIPHITEGWVAAAFKNDPDRTPVDREELRLSDELVGELKEADIYVLGVPMYNWSVPSGLKAYIDQVMRINETWRFRSGKPDGDYVGLLEGKKMFVLSSRGDSGYGKGEKNEKMNFQTTYLELVFGIMGITDIHVVSVDNEEYGGERFARSREGAYERLMGMMNEGLEKA